VDHDAHDLPFPGFGGSLHDAQYRCWLHGGKGRFRTSAFTGGLRLLGQYSESLPAPPISLERSPHILISVLTAFVNIPLNVSSSVEKRKTPELHAACALLIGILFHEKIQGVVHVPDMMRPAISIVVLVLPSAYVG
jgi:hypothetical protein